MFKVFCLTLYGSFGLACLGIVALPNRPELFGVRRPAHGLGAVPVLLTLAAMMLLVAYIATGSLLLIGASLTAAIIFLLGRTAWASPAMVFGGCSTAVIVLSLVWWQMTPSQASPIPLTAYAVVLVALLFGLSDPGRHRTRFVLLPVVLFLFAGLVLVVDLGSYRLGQPQAVVLDHHWGAFIGPALHVRAGLVPLYDVPLQYGLGPTLTIAATCNGNDCWLAAEVAFVGATLANGLLVLAMALVTSRQRGAPWLLAVTIVVFAAVFLWPGFPMDGSLLLGTPSVGGMRFLPVTLIACLWFFGRPSAAAAAMIPAALWSPESAAMSVTVFGLCATAHYGLLRAVLLSAALLFGSYAALVLVHRTIFGVWIDPIALIEYVLHVPGPLPIDPFSDVLLLAATLGLGIWLVYRSSEDSVGRRRDLAVTGLLFAVASYSFGRSHPNNICNLAPFLVLVGLRALDRVKPEHLAVGKVVALGLAVSVASLAFSPWRSVPFDPHFVLDIRRVVSGFGALEPDIAKIRQLIPRDPELGIADFGPAYVRDPSERIVWTPMDPSSLWSYVPAVRRRLYIERSMRRLRRSGWAIFVDRQLFLFDDLRSVYRLAGQRSFDGAPLTPGGPATHYTVACFDPRPEVAIDNVGPSCPATSTGFLAAAVPPEPVVR